MLDSAEELSHRFGRFAVHKIKSLFWMHYYRRVREPKMKLDSTLDFQVPIEILERNLCKHGFEIEHYQIDTSGYIDYLKSADYHTFGHYQRAGKAPNFSEKSLEHYLAAKLLNLSEDDVFIDIACADSPAAEIYHKLYGCSVYKQDLIFPDGLCGNIIGGNACNMPLPDGFATKMALHCSFEHFEQNSDIGFIREAGRVLRKGGLMCIVPLYLSTQYVILTDPVCLSRDDMISESNAVLCCVKGWRNRHGRYYAVPNLVNRIRNNLGSLKMTIFIIQNEKEISSRCYVKFAALFRRLA